MLGGASTRRRTSLGDDDQVGGVADIVAYRAKDKAEKPKRETVETIPPADPHIPAGYYRPITNPEVRAAFEKADPAVKAWLLQFKSLSTQKRESAYSLFLNLTAIGDLDVGEPEQPSAIAA